VAGILGKNVQDLLHASAFPSSLFPKAVRPVLAMARKMDRKGIGSIEISPAEGKISVSSRVVA
jgi:hypothetical protein